MMTNFRRWISSLGICAICGAIAGVVVGFIFELIELGVPPRFTLAAALRLGMGLGVFGWIVLIVFVGLIAGYGFRRMAFPSLLTALLTAVFTVLINNALWVALLAVPVGFVTGLVIGALLCRLCGDPVSEESRA